MFLRPVPVAGHLGGPAGGPHRCYVLPPLDSNRRYLPWALVHVHSANLRRKPIAMIQPQLKALIRQHRGFGDSLTRTRVRDLALTPPMDL